MLQDAFNLMGTAGAGAVNRRWVIEHTMDSPKIALSLCAALAALICSFLATASQAADPPAQDCHQ